MMTAEKRHIPEPDSPMNMEEMSSFVRALPIGAEQKSILLRHFMKQQQTIWEQQIRIEEKDEQIAKLNREIFSPIYGRYEPLSPYCKDEQTTGFLKHKLRLFARETGSRKRGYYHKLAAIICTMEHLGWVRPIIESAPNCEFWRLIHKEMETDHPFKVNSAQRAYNDFSQQKHSRADEDLRISEMKTEYDDYLSLTA